MTSEPKDNDELILVCGLPVKSRYFAFDSFCSQPDAASEEFNTRYQCHQPCEESNRRLITAVNLLSHSKVTTYAENFMALARYQYGVFSTERLYIILKVVQDLNECLSREGSAVSLGINCLKPILDTCMLYQLPLATLANEPRANFSWLMLCFESDSFDV